jgi:DNA modification methylase
MNITLLHGDCREQLQSLIDQGIQVDSIVTDPPYEMGFMGKSWDGTGIANDVDMWRLCLKVLKPGGHLLSFGGTRTYHRMTCAIEDAGFEIRDCVNWIYGSGFPKSLDISKKIDKMAGAEREIVGSKEYADGSKARKTSKYAEGCYHESETRGENNFITAPSTDAAKQWSGFGTALKPAFEPIVLARKPLSEKNIASNVLKHGVGAINIDGCRVGMMTEQEIARSGKSTNGMFALGEIDWKRSDKAPTGRFPANIIHDGSDEVESEFAKYGESKSNNNIRHNNEHKSIAMGKINATLAYGYKDNGSASRFFYCAKASKRERNLGLDKMELSTTDDGRNKSIDNPFQRGETLRHNNHPTVKPIALMCYLCRLVTPPNGTVLDPFLGSGSTGIAAKQEGFSFIGIEKEADYMEIAKARIGLSGD